MRTFEFDAEISEERTLKIPQELAKQVDSHQVVHVILHIGDGKEEPKPPDEKAAAVMATFGACKDDGSLVEIFKEIDKERHAYLGREVNIP
jgi:hypothetical protein